MKDADAATRTKAYREARLFVGPRGGRIQITVYGAQLIGTRWWPRAVTSISCGTVSGTPG
ncbi:hypothetical protein [Nocardia sp. NPDC005825]|uniref:hypothetical protein n=1 Tax=unclassified Nocardia TaxID=2637762 RepID=UPI00340162DD